MTRFLGISAIVALALFMIVPTASAQRGAGFAWHGGFYGGGFYPVSWGWGWYGPGWGWYGPYGWGWGYPYSYGPVLYSGQVKIVNTPKDSLVYVDGGYAGTVAKLKKFPLKPGNHTIDLRYPSGHSFHQERIHVIPGKTLEIRGSVGGH